MTEHIHTWTRRELEEAVKIDPDEKIKLKVEITPRFLLLLMDYQSQHGETVELVSAYGDPLNVEMRFFWGDKK